jgi:hypothetical protein
MFDDKYANYYQTYLSHHLYLQAFLLYGFNRNKFLRTIFLQELELFPLPQFLNPVYLRSKSVFDLLKKYFDKIDSSIYSYKLPN